MTTLLKAVTGLGFTGFDAIMMIRNGTVYVDGVQRINPVFQIKKPCAIHAGGQRLWVSPSPVKVVFDDDQ